MTDEEDDEDYDDASSSSDSDDEPTPSINANSQTTSSKRKVSLIQTMINLFRKNKKINENKTNELETARHKRNLSAVEEKKKKTEEKKKARAQRRKKAKNKKKKKVIQRCSSSESEIYNVTSILEINEGLDALERNNGAHTNLEFSTPSTILLHITGEKTENCSKSPEGCGRKPAKAEKNQSVSKLQHYFNKPQTNARDKFIGTSVSASSLRVKDPVASLQTESSSSSADESDAEKASLSTPVDNTRAEKTKIRPSGCPLDTQERPRFYRVNEKADNSFKSYHVDGKPEMYDVASYYALCDPISAANSLGSLYPYLKPNQSDHYSPLKEENNFYSHMRASELNKPSGQQQFVDFSDLETLSTLANAESAISVMVPKTERDESFSNVHRSASTSGIINPTSSLVESVDIDPNSNEPCKTSLQMIHSKTATSVLWRDAPGNFGAFEYAKGKQNKAKARHITGMEMEQDFKYLNKLEDCKIDAKDVGNTGDTRFELDQLSMRAAVSTEYMWSSEDISRKDDRKSTASIKLGNMSKTACSRSAGMNKPTSYFSEKPQRKKNAMNSSERQALSKKLRKRHILITVALCLCIGGVIFLSTAAAYEMSMHDNQHPTPETSLRQFISSLQVQKVGNETADWSSDLKDMKSSRAQKIINALKPIIRSAFEAEGFATDHVSITKIGPVSVTIYHVLNQTVTSLSSSEEISLASSSENHKDQLPAADKPHPQGHKTVIRVEFETSGKLSVNAKVVNQVGEPEAAKMQYMIDKYIRNQGVIAKVDTIKVSSEFRRKARTVTPKPNVQFLNSVSEPELDIECFKTASEMGISRAIVRCPPQCIRVKNHVVTGTNWYHIKSMICLTAIHSYIIENDEGGVVEFLTAGNSFLFVGSTKNGITSSSLFGYGKKFIVKAPGPSWTSFKVATSTAIPPTQPGLQEASLILLAGRMTAISVDNTPIIFSLGLSYSTKLATEMNNFLRDKILYSLEDINFKLDRVKVFGFQPDHTVAMALRFSFSAFGKYSKNLEALIKYKPWNNDMVMKLSFNLKRNLNVDGLQLTGLAVKINNDVIEKLSTLPPTTAPPNNTPSLCTCAEVFFIQSAVNVELKSEVASIVNMYKKLFQLADFDQFRLKFGMALIVPKDSEQAINGETNIVVTDVGQLSTTAIITELEYQLITVVESRVRKSDVEELMATLMDIEDLKFFKDDFGTREKLLVVNSDTVFGPEAEYIDSYLRNLKLKGIKVLYTGYNWNIIDGYPEAYVSEPKIDFIKSVREIKDLAEVAMYTVNVMRKYTCSQSLGICKHRSLGNGENSLFDVGGREESQSFIIPKGTGLKPYKVTGGLVYNNMNLYATDSWRLTEPDENQAFYMLYECGRPAVQPDAFFKEGRIVGGTQAMPHSWPWIISINRLRSKYNTLLQKEIYTYNYWKCGGTIVAFHWAITAAHCFAKGNEKKYTSEYKVVVGIYDQNKLDELEGNVHKIRRIVYHPFYDDAKNKYDVALIQTHKAFEFKRDVLPACLPNPNVIPLDGKVCMLAGWGYTNTKGDTDRNILKQAVQYIENPRTCQSVYRAIGYNPNTNICSKKSTTESSDMQCRGDSGGPLVCFENTKWVLYGVANWGPRDCQKRGYGGYLLVPSMMEWICCYITSDIAPCRHTKCNELLT